MKLILIVARLGRLTMLGMAFLLVINSQASARYSSRDSDNGWAACAARHTCDPASAARYERYATVVKRGDVAALTDLHKALVYWHKAAGMPGLPFCLSSPLQVRIAAANTVLARALKPAFERYNDEFDRRWLHNRCNVP